MQERSRWRASSRPHNLDAEMSVLGALLLVRHDRRHLPAAPADDFYRSAHREIYSAVLELYNKRAEIDGISVAEELRRAAPWPSPAARSTWSRSPSRAVGGIRRVARQDRAREGDAAAHGEPGTNSSGTG